MEIFKVKYFLLGYLLNFSKICVFIMKELKEITTTVCSTEVLSGGISFPLFFHIRTYRQTFRA